MNLLCCPSFFVDMKLTPLLFSYQNSNPLKNQKKAKKDKNPTARKSLTICLLSATLNLDR
jgi:hypothetical protein